MSLERDSLCLNEFREGNYIGLGLTLYVSMRGRENGCQDLYYVCDSVEKLDVLSTHVGSSVAASTDGIVPGDEQFLSPTSLAGLNDKRKGQETRSRTRR